MVVLPKLVAERGDTRQGHQQKRLRHRVGEKNPEPQLRKVHEYPPRSVWA